MRPYEFQPGEVLDEVGGMVMPWRTILDLDAIVRATWNENNSRHLLMLTDGSDVRLSQAGFDRVVAAWTGRERQDSTRS